MRERDIEKSLIAAVKNRGGPALKFTSPGMVGIPDRLVLLQCGRLAFVELKAPGKAMRPIQKRRKTQLESLGFLVFCVDDPAQIGGVLDGIQSP